MPMCSQMRSWNAGVQLVRQDKGHGERRGLSGGSGVRSPRSMQYENSPATYSGAEYQCPGDATNGGLLGELRKISLVVLVVARATRQTFSTSEVLLTLGCCQWRPTVVRSYRRQAEERSVLVPGLRRCVLLTAGEPAGRSTLARPPATTTLGVQLCSASGRLPCR